MRFSVIFCIYEHIKNVLQFFENIENLKFSVYVYIYIYIYIYI